MDTYNYMSIYTYVYLNYMSGYTLNEIMGYE